MQETGHCRLNAKHLLVLDNAYKSHCKSLKSHLIVNSCHFNLCALMGYQSDVYSATQPEIAVDEQVEFYFSDSNAPRDMFLMGKIEAHPEVVS